MECDPADGQSNQLDGTHRQTYTDILTEVLTLAKDLCVAAIPSLNDSRQNFIWAIESIFMTLALLSVALRLVARRLSNAKFGWDDALILVSLVSFVNLLG